MKQLIWKIAFIVTIMVLFGISIFPPSARLRLGKDLAGGTTLIYGVKPDADGIPPTSQQIQQIINVIRERIDPNNLYNISIVAQGTNQIEISMPLPTPDVREAKRILEQLVEDLDKTAVNEDAFDAAVGMDVQARAKRFEDFSLTLPQRRRYLDAAATAHDNQERLRAEYQELDAERRQITDTLEQALTAAQRARSDALIAVNDAGIPTGDVLALSALDDAVEKAQKIAELVATAPDAEQALKHYLEKDEALTPAREANDEAAAEWDTRVTPVEKAAAAAIAHYRAAREAVLATSIDVDELRRALSLPQKQTRFRDPRTRVWIVYDSQRDLAIERIKAQNNALHGRIDEVIAAYDHYRSLSKGYDDPKDLITLLRGAGVLSFRIVARTSDPLPIDALRDELREGGPRNVESSNIVAWYPLDKLEQWYDRPEELGSLQSDPAAYFKNRRGYVCDSYDGQIYMLLYTSRDRSLDDTAGPWKVVKANPTSDNLGLPAVAFNLDANGGNKFGRLTGENVSRPMGIVLDDRVYTAANINSRISRRGIIQGRFSRSDVDYLLKVLNAGALQAQLTEAPIAQNTIGPKLGSDNLQRGLEAGLIAIVAVAAFMMLYYFFAGLVANVALLCNAIIILGAMSLNQAAFTMPGIAGIVLTFGMAVDANVLIYERIREEFIAGADLKTAIRLGYEKVYSTIIDANVTNLIVCLVLGFTATAEVKGFAITLGIGIIATLFSTLFITRVIFTVYADYMHAKTLPMLPLVWPALNRFLHPNIAWVRMRRTVWTVSALVVVASLVLTYATWDDMLDTEFRGGVSATITFKQDEQGNPIQLPRGEVERRLLEYAQQAQADGLIDSETSRALQAASVYNYNMDQVTGDDYRGSAFVVRTTLEDENAVEAAIIAAFQGILDIREPITFEDADLTDATIAPVYAVVDDILGDVINDPVYSNNVKRFRGGVAVVLKDLQPASSLREIRKRLDRQRQSKDYERYFGRHIEIIPRPGGAVGSDATGQITYNEMILLVAVEDIDYYKQQDDWKLHARDKEWEIAILGLTRPPSLDQVTKISAEVATQFRAKAIVAIILSLLGILAYIWVRFGSLRYSLAAIIALVHDVCVTLGLLSLTHYLFGTFVGRMLFIEPFKIDLGVVAALLTIIGYSLNDTIVILDRIRENRGKLAVTSESVVNRSINQTISRTLITSGTTLVAVLIMYAEGGTGIRPFTFAMLCGVVVGTYSSVGIAAPMVYKVMGVKKGGSDEARTPD